MKLNTLFLLLLTVTIALSACGGNSRSLTAQLARSVDVESVKLVTLGEDGITPVPGDGRFELVVDGMTARVIARDLAGCEHAYFLLSYPANEMAPLEMKRGGLLPEDDTIALTINHEPGEVVMGFARIRPQDYGGLSGSGNLFTVQFAPGGDANARSTAAAPEASINRVRDLEVSPVGDDTYHLEWTERNVGDYNVDGSVNIADITPIASRYGNVVGDGVDDLRDRPVDGDDNGAIGISDITPLAMNYGSRLDGYVVHRRTGLYDEFAPVSGVLERYLNNGEGVLPSYAFDDVGVPTGVYVSYEVRPVDQSGAEPVEGVGSRDQSIDPSSFNELMAEIIAIEPQDYGTEELAEVFETYLFLFGGPQLGVVDGDGTELSNNVVPEENIMSLRHEGALQLAEMWQTLSPYTLEQVLQTYIDDLVWDEPPTLAELLALQQEVVNDAWANYGEDQSAWAIILQFNQGDTLSETAPVLANETELDVFQAWALTVSFVRWMETEGKGASGVGNTLVFYPNMPGSPDDAGGFTTRLYNQWSSTSFTRRVLHAGAGAAGSVGLAVLLGNPVSLPIVAGVAVFSFIIKPPAGALYDIGNNAVSNFETPMVTSAAVDTEPIPDTQPPEHIVHITWQSTVPIGGDGGPSFEILRAESTDGPWEVVRKTHNDWSWGGTSFDNWVDNGGGSYTLADVGATQGKSYVYKVRRRDMRWGPDNLVPSGNHIVVTIPAGPSVIGFVHNNAGAPIANINCSTSDGQRNWSATTGADGRFKLLDITAGQRVISFSARGFSTHMEQVLVANEVTALDIMLPAYVGDVTARPDIVDFYYEQSTADITAGLAWLRGQVVNLDGPQIILIQNGSEILFEVDENGYFNYRAVLEPGNNTFQIRAVNALGETKSDEMEIMFHAEFVFRVTLTWNMGGGSDIDLYTRDPSGDVSYYSNKAINSGSLDVDNTSGFGPENFTCYWDAGEGVPEDGTYEIGVNYYSDHQADPSGDPPIPPRVVGCQVRVITNPDTDDEQTQYFSGSVSVPNGGGDWFGGGASWWLPVTITVTDGVATIGG